MAEKNTNNNLVPVKGAIVTRLGDILHDSDGLICLVKLNFLFILTCLPIIPLLPVFTAGPAVKALLYCTNELVRTGYLPDVKEKYLREYKSNTAYSIRAGALVVIFTCIFVFGMYFYLVMSGQNIMYIPFASLSLLMLIFIWGIAAHIFPGLSAADSNSGGHFSAAFSAMITSLPKTIISVIISFVFITGQILFLPASLPLMLTLGFSVPALCCAFAHTEPEFV